MTLFDLINNLQAGLCYALYSYYLDTFRVLGIQVVRGRGSTRVYPFDEAQKQRTHHEMELWTLEALEKETAIIGVERPSMLSKISHFAMVNVFVPDFLLVLYLEWHVNLYLFGLTAVTTKAHGTLDSLPNKQFMTV